VRHRLEQGAYLALRAVLRAVPHSAARRLGAALGATAHAADRRHRRVVADNLAHAFPGLSAAERRSLSRGCFRHFGAALCDALSAQRFGPVELCRRVTLAGWEHLVAADERRQGVLVMGAHLGTWELIPSLVALYRGPMHVVGRPADNPWIDREVVRLRERFGGIALDKRGSVRPMLKALAEGGRVGLLIDQRVHPREGIRVPFFGRPAVTSPLLARLSLRHRAPVVPVLGDLEPGGRYRVTFYPPIEPTGDDDRDNRIKGDDAVAVLTGRYLAFVESRIRERPAQWLWMHERWKGAA
jgi:KDO2-lipid IV(A) lauroyltransferase